MSPTWARVTRGPAKPAISAIHATARMRVIRSRPAYWSECAVVPAGVGEQTSYPPFRSIQPPAVASLSAVAAIPIAWYPLSTYTVLPVIPLESGLARNAAV